MNLAKLNHIFIPPSWEQRQRLRRSWLGRIVRPVGWLYSALSVEGRALSVLILFVGAAALEVGSTQVYLLWGVLVALLLASLAVRWPFRLREVSVEVTAPERVSVGEPMTFSCVVTNHGAADAHGLRWSGPFLPWDGRWLSPPPAVGQAPAGGSVRREMRARFVQRGPHHLDPFVAAAVVPLGLATGPSLAAAGPRFVVVPRIAPVQNVALPVTLRYQPGGVAQASRTGEAMELYGVRPYRRGDRVRDLHARTWARTGKPHVREYQQEYFTRIGVILDNDRRISTEAGLEAAISLAAGVVARLSRGEALVDLLVVNWEIHPLTIGRSLGFLDQALDLLAAVEPGPSLDPPVLLARLRPHLTQLSCVVLVTQDGPARGGRSVASRRELAQRIEELGVCCRTLRVTADEAPRDATQASEQTERAVPMRVIHGSRPFNL